MTQNSSSISRLRDSAHGSEAATNSSTDTTNMRTAPNRVDSQPVRGTPMALETAKEVITQVPCAGDTPRSPEIAGIETLAMVVSSTFMNVASDSARAASSSVWPWSGGCNAGDAPASAMVRRQPAGVA